LLVGRVPGSKRLGWVRIFVRMTMHTPRLLTKEELASLIEFAATADSHMPPAHLAKLVALGYVLETAKGPVVTGDGLMRITEGE
jgi:hypothetical protein